MKDENAVVLGRKGGSAKTAAKLAAVAENLKRARLKRWVKVPEPTAVIEKPYEKYKTPGQGG